MPAKPTPESASGTQAIKRAVSLLRLIASNNRTGMRLVDLYTAAGLERPTAYRLLQGLISENMVRQDAKSRRYFLGRLMYEMGGSAAPQTALRDICHPYLQSIAERTGDTVFLTVRSGLDGVCLDRVEGAFPVKVFVLDIGRRRPLNVGGGAIALLSALPDAEVDKILKGNQAYVREKYPNYAEKKLRARIATARSQGYVQNDLLEVPGVSSIGVAICKRDHTPVGAISVSALASRLSGDRAKLVASYLIEAASNIQSALDG
ncbi:MAG TPA: IclR family transcriptional regulator [Bordetella sp.]